MSKHHALLPQLPNKLRKAATNRPPTSAYLTVTPGEVMKLADYIEARHKQIGELEYRLNVTETKLKEMK